MESQPHQPEQRSDDAAHRRRVPRWLPPAAVAIVTAAMLAWTWDKCPELITDFGREAYVPWRVSEGAVLYRDVNYFNGPVAPYVNAMLFELLGPSVRTLKLANAAIAVLTSLLIYWMVRRIGDALAGLVAGVTFPALFAAAHLGDAGNFNWLTPYSHDATHGVALSLAMLACLWQAQALQRLTWLAAAGFLFGLVLLTKVEVVLAAALAAAGALAVILTSIKPGTNRPTRGRAAAAFVLMALAPPVLAIALLASAMPLGDAVRGVFGALAWLGDDRITGLWFFRWSMGLVDAEANLMRMLGWAGGYALLIAAAGGLAMLLRPRTSSAAAVVAVIATLVVAVAMELTWRRVVWSGILRPLPLVTAVVLVVVTLRWLNRRDPPERVLPVLSLALFGGALLPKVILYVRPSHYGFVLAAPATMLLVALLVAWVPAAVARLGGAPWVARGIVIAVVAVLLRAHVAATAEWVARRTVVTERGPDRFYADVRGAAVNEVMGVLESRRAPGDTLLALPEGAMINFLLRMPSTSRYQNFLPSEMMIYGEHAMLDELRRRPPTYVALVHRPAKEYEPTGPLGKGGRFGIDYATQFAAWLNADYHPVWLAGAMPYAGEEFGILLWRRNDGRAPARAFADHVALAAFAACDHARRARR